jgi:hypothetical protein
LNRVYDYSYSVKLFDQYLRYVLAPESQFEYQGNRHKMTPSLSFSYRPDFGAERFGYWQEVQIDTTGRVRYFDVNDGGIYGGSPGRGASGAISLSVNNNLEAKVLDTEGYNQNRCRASLQKVKIIDNLSFGTSYNLIADSLNLAPINIRARTTVAGVSVNMGGVLDPYMTDEDGVKIHKYVWNEKSGLGKLGRLNPCKPFIWNEFQIETRGKAGRTKPGMIEEENVLPGDYSIILILIFHGILVSITVLIMPAR